ncbi:hypothetical protein GCM10010430_65210 [Kitasatospora cystarginea]|uniref:Uncharacterized protein n=1 Tax=Kitasatospora cystarginea TaxID=58350 RepID=A0ABP5RPZ9_9ACTN
MQGSRPSRGRSPCCGACGSSDMMTDARTITGAGSGTPCAPTDVTLVRGFVVYYITVEAAEVGNP